MLLFNQNIISNASVCEIHYFTTRENLPLYDQSLSLLGYLDIPQLKKKMKSPDLDDIFELEDDMDSELGEL